MKKGSTWEKCNKENLRYEMSATLKSSTWKQRSLRKSSREKGRREKSKTRNKSKVEVQTKTSATWKVCYSRRYAKEKDATWKEYNTKEGGPKKVQDKIPAWWNKWNTKIVQLERGETLKCNKEKVHEQSATWNNTKKMKHKKGLQRNTKKVAIWK